MEGGRRLMLGTRREEEEERTEREQIRGNPEKEVLFPASAHGPVPSRWHDRGYIRQDDADRKLIVPPSTESNSVQARAQVVEVTRKKYSRVTAEFQTKRSRYDPGPHNSPDRI